MYQQCTASRITSAEPACPIRGSCIKGSWSGTELSAAAEGPVRLARGSRVGAACCASCTYPRHRHVQAHHNSCYPAPRDSNRGYNTELLSALTFVAVPGCGIADLLSNRVFMAGFTAWFIAQFTKVQNEHGCNYDRSSITYIGFTRTAVSADLHEADKDRSLGCQGNRGLRWHAIVSLCTLLGKPSTISMMCCA
jgi:hypothetical protein